MNEVMESKLGSPLERLAIIKDMRIEAEIGDVDNNNHIDSNVLNSISFNDTDIALETSNSNGSTLRSVDRLEQFLL